MFKTRRTIFWACQGKTCTLTERIMEKNFLYELILTEFSPTDLPALFAEPLMGTTKGIHEESLHEERMLLSLL